MDYEDDLIIEPFEAFLKSRGTAADKIGDGSWKKNKIYDQSKKNAQKAKGNQELKSQPAQTTQTSAAAPAPAPATSSTSPPAAAPSTGIVSSKGTGTAADKTDKKAMAGGVVTGAAHVLDGVANATAVAGKAFKNGLLNANASGLNTVNAVKTAGMETVQALGSVPEKIANENMDIKAKQDVKEYNEKIDDIIASAKTTDEMGQNLMAEYNEVLRTQGNAAAKRFSSAATAAMKRKKNETDNDLIQARMDRSRVGLDTWRAQNDRKLEMTQRKMDAVDQSDEKYASAHKDLEQYLNKDDDARKQYEFLAKIMGNEGRNENDVPIIMSYLQDKGGNTISSIGAPDFLNKGYGGVAEDNDVLNAVDAMLNRVSLDGLSDEEKQIYSDLKKDVAKKKSYIKFMNEPYNVEGKKEGMREFAEGLAKEFCESLDPRRIPSIYGGNKDAMIKDVATRLGGLALAFPHASVGKLYEKLENVYSSTGQGYEDAGYVMRAIDEKYHSTLSKHLADVHNTTDLRNLSPEIKGELVDLYAQTKAAECNRQAQAALKAISKVLSSGTIEERDRNILYNSPLAGKAMSAIKTSTVYITKDDREKLEAAMDQIYKDNLNAQSEIMQGITNFNAGTDIVAVMEGMRDNKTWWGMKNDIRTIAGEYPEVATEELGSDKPNVTSDLISTVETLITNNDSRVGNVGVEVVNNGGNTSNSNSGSAGPNIKYPLKEGTIGSQTLHSKLVQDMIQMYDQDNSFDASFYTNGKRRRQFIDKRKDLIKEMNKKVKGETPEQERKRKSDMARVIAYFDLGYVRNYLINRERNLIPGFGENKDKELEQIYRDATGDMTTPPTEISNKVDNLLRFANHFILDVSDGKNRLGSYNTMVIDHVYGQAYSNSKEEAGLLGYMDNGTLGKRGKELYKPFSNYARCATNVLKGLSSMVNVLSSSGASIDHAEEALNTGKWKNIRDLEPQRRARTP